MAKMENACFRQPVEGLVLHDVRYDDDGKETYSL